ncbi:hypothetical protein [Streptomyces sp. NRRL B-3648]|uniref:hypothetical protein n=1 Tax=Streptomyces sp. NRRL B-3648 TaxID=1519493 RepID=UPI00099B4B44|nr:hypothetical protein [Streptomyces sp. NRRL B-3648]
MTNPPPTKSLTLTPAESSAAGPAAPRPAVGDPKGAARKGVPSALRPDPHPQDGRWPVAWLCITSPRYGHMPTAVSQCQCGWNRSAIGHAQVAALIEAHTAHRDTCPLRHPQEGRAAA